MMLHQEKGLSNDSRRPLSCNDFTDKKGKITTNRSCVLCVLGFLSQPIIIQSSRFYK